MLSQQLQLDHIFGFTDPQYNHLSTLSPHIRQIINHEKYIQSYYLSTRMEENVDYVVDTKIWFD
jgi:hypothetical protein